MAKPNFLIIGAGKAGTTSLYEYLKQHPQIFMSPIKETNFFAYEGPYQMLTPADAMDKREFFPIRDLETYMALFNDVRDEVAIGEASPRYLPAPGAARRIRQQLPDVKLIAMLRDPSERAYSSYLMYSALEYERRTFQQAIHDEQAGVNKDLPSGQWRYLAVGLYYRQLRRYLELFDRNQIEIYFFEDLARDAISLLRRIFLFLNVDDQFCPDTSVKFHPSGVPRNRLLHWVLRKRPATTAVKNRLPEWLRRRANARVVTMQRSNLAKPPLRDELREQLVSFYREDIQNLQRLTDRDLSHWLRPTTMPATESADG